MTYVVTGACVGTMDRSCIDVCPVDCIHEFARMVVIDPDACIDCAACEHACPAEAIHAEDEVPAEWASFVAVTRAVHTGADTVDALIEEALRG
jgi:NAD-dependent dihydropyrimidine dehydrogenase PreA subunit